MLYWKPHERLIYMVNLVGKCTRKRSQLQRKIRWRQATGDARSCRGGQWHSEGEDVLQGRCYGIVSGQSITTSADVTLNCGLERESPSKSPQFRFRNYTNLPRFFGVLWLQVCVCCFLVQVVGWSFWKFFATWKDWQKAADASLSLGGMFCSYKKNTYQMQESHSDDIGNPNLHLIEKLALLDWISPQKKMYNSQIVI